MNPLPHVLIVDDDREIRALLSRYLAGQGYWTTAAADGREMREAMAGRAIDLIVLDLMLPGEDGLALCRWIRAQANDQSYVPVIMLTARGEDIDRIVGLEMGADDYLAKPFNPRELVARINAVLRRTGRASAGVSGRGFGGRAADDQGEIVTFAGWALDIAARRLTAPDGTLVPLSAGEFGLLAAFVSHPQRVLSRDRLLDLARGREAQPFDRAIDVQVSRLRRKIEQDPSDPQLITTVRGGGYMFTPPVSTLPAARQ
jgi:two-component system, OmpR family, response regulator